MNPNVYFLLNILTYHNNDKIIMIYFSNMCCDVEYHLVKSQLKTPPMHGEMKRINYVMGQFEPKSIIWGVK